MKIILGLTVFLSSQVMAQMKPSLEEFSRKLNEDLPEVYDPVTKLRKTTVENNHFIYHFLVNATQKENDWVMPKVKERVLSSICSNKNQHQILSSYRANIVYRYENVKGQYLGEFMVTPDRCSK